MEPITTAASWLLSKIVLDKFYEGVSSKLGEKAVEKAIAPIEALGKFVWGRCVKLAKDPKKATEVLQAAANGSETAKQSIVGAVDSVLSDTAVEQDVRKLAAELHQTIVQIDDDSTMTQVNRDNAKGWQTKVQGGTAYIGDITINQKG